MTWLEPNGHEEPYTPFTQRPFFRAIALFVTILVVLAMIALTLGPYLIERSGRPPGVTTTLVQV